jgi:hypothetical protein
VTQERSKGFPAYGEIQLGDMRKIRLRSFADSVNLREEHLIVVIVVMKRSPTPYLTLQCSELPFIEAIIMAFIQIVENRFCAEVP